AASAARRRRRAARSSEGRRTRSIRARARVRRTRPPRATDDRRRLRPRRSRRRRFGRAAPRASIGRRGWGCNPSPTATGTRGAPASSVLLGQLDAQAVRVRDDGIRLQRHVDGPAERLAGTHVELAAVAVALHHVTLEVSLGARAALVGALVLEGEERAVDVGDRAAVAFAADREELAGRGRLRHDQGLVLLGRHAATTWRVRRLRKPKPDGADGRSWSSRRSGNRANSRSTAMRASRFATLNPMQWCSPRLNAMW